jgi:NitT/TauT family transport system substrate-binding protein
MRKKGLILLFLMLSSFFVFSDNKILKILVPPSTSSIPFFILAKNDPIPGIDIRADIFINHAQALAMLIRRETDLLFTGTSQGWQNRLDGGPVVMINTGVWAVSYFIGRDQNIKSFSDLKGKSIALPFPGSPLDFQTRFILSKEGIDPEKDLQISYSSFPHTVSRLLLGQIDAAPLPEPLATNLVLNKGLTRLIDYKEAWARVSGGEKGSPQVSLFSTDVFIQKEKKLIAELINGGMPPLKFRRILVRQPYSLRNFFPCRLK